MNGRKLFLVVIALFLFVLNSSALTVIGRDIEDDDFDWHVWGDDAVAEDTILFTQSSHISTGVDVVVYPGVVVCIHEFSFIVVDGGASITAIGNETSPITFTSSGVRTVPPSPAAGDWEEIRFLGTALDGDAEGDFEYCIFNYGGEEESSLSPFSEVNGVVRTEGFAKVTIKNCTFAHCAGSAIGSNSAQTNVLYIDNNAIYDCQNGIKLETQDEYDGGLTYIKRNIILDAEYAIAIETDVSDIEIKNNLIANVSIYGITSGGNAIINNNTVAHTDNIAIYLIDEVSEVVNNILYDYTNYGVYISAGNQTVYNTCFDVSSGLRGNGNISIDPSCVDDNTDVFAEPNAAVDSPDDAFDYHLWWDCLAVHSGDGTDNLNDTPCDMGCYGGSEAIEPYYLAIGGTLDDETTLLDTLGSPIYVIDDVTIASGDSVYIGATINEFEFKCLEDVDWIVSGKLVVDGTPPSVGGTICFTAVDPDEPWGMFELNGSSVCEFEYAEISNANDGICLYNTSKINLTHVDFDDITSGGARIASTSTSNFESCTFNNCNDIGVSVVNGFLNMYLCDIVECRSGIDVQNADAFIDSCEIKNNIKIGLYAYNSSPTVHRSYFFKNGMNGIKCSSSGDVVLGIASNENFGNRLRENGGSTVSASRASEVYVYASTPVIFKRYNDFVDPRTEGNNAYLWYTNATTPISGNGNYWEGPAGDYNDWFYPYGYVNEAANWCADDNRDLYTLTNFDYADLCVEDEEWEDAAGLYWRAFNEDGEAAALKRWIFCHRLLGTDPEDLLDDLDDLGEVEGMESTLFWNRILLQNRVEDFEASIDMLDDFIEDAETDLDETMGLLGQLETYYQMALANYGGRETLSLGTHVNRDLRPLGLTQLGENSWVVPENFADYEAKRELLHQSVDDPSLRIDTGLPKEFVLEAAYPNPFNPTVTIPFTLPHSANVKLAVFNMLGQRVETLVDRQLDAGRHSIVWNGNAHASGVYFVRLESPEAVQTQRLVLMK